eukprot:TRINITY_DN73592_c0_g1_i1.p1 TRINITY_DN73592_c0_g1~~TRINITY_DN73592_c0_g1_i1.p1  ORF type:complete len:318 (-),score=36.11 TRINITY_DN73592_c0_g1_i1:353-1273(-)
MATAPADVTPFLGGCSTRLPADACRSKAVTVAAACAVAGLLSVFGLIATRAKATVASTSASALAAQDGPAKVQVTLYGMAGCPFTRGFIEGPVSEMLATSSDIVDFRFHPFGNSYYATEHCGGTAVGMPFASYNKGYNQTIRECWDKMCGAPVVEPPKDCFLGTLICQHGTTDGMLTTAWACAKSIANDEPFKFMPFVRCTADRYLGITNDASFHDVVEDCAKTTGFGRAEILSCAKGKRGRVLLNVEARQTVSHPGVPYALVDGKVLTDTACVACGDGLMQKVCEAWRVNGGVDTRTCQGIFGNV